MATFPPEPEIINAELPFDSAQAALDGEVIQTITEFASCSWYGAVVSPDYGCFAIVRDDGPLADFVGDRLRLTDATSGATVVVYCVTTISDIDEDVLIARRPFAAFADLAITPISVLVEVLGG